MKAAYMPCLIGAFGMVAVFGNVFPPNGDRHTIWEITKAAHAAEAAHRKGDLIEVTFYSIRNDATVLAFKEGKYLVRYEDKDAPDEWVEAERVLRADKGKTAAGPPLGKYDCYMPMYEHSYMGSFVIDKQGSYRYLTGTKGRGTYKYDPKTRKVTWLSGPLAKIVTRGEYENTKRNGPTIVLIFSKGKRKGDIQNCLWRGKHK